MNDLNVKPAAPDAVATPTEPEKRRAPRGGQAGGRRRAPKSRYGQQMQEKQNLKEIYGIREEQLRKYYAEARRSKTSTGEQLISLLERRLDNAIYRAGLAPTRPAARQMATHRLFAVNNRPVDIPSYRVKPGDIISVRESKRNKSYFTNWDKRTQNLQPPTWITLDPASYSIRIQAEPTAEQSNVGIDVQAIVEFFAR